MLSLLYYFPKTITTTLHPPNSPSPALHLGAEEVYAAAAAPLVRHALDGGHATLFTYGQTGARQLRAYYNTYTTLHLY
jgi:hypothetical protein